MVRNGVSIGVIVVYRKEPGVLATLRSNWFLILQLKP